MEMEPVLVRVNLFWIITAYRAAIDERNEFCGVVCGGPLVKVIDLHLNDVVQLKVSSGSCYSGRRSRCGRSGLSLDCFGRRGWGGGKRNTLVPRHLLSPHKLKQN